MCETNSLSTTDLLRRAVASETFKEQSEKKIGFLLPSMAGATKAFIMSLFLPIYHGHEPTVVLQNKQLSIFHRTFDQI